MSFDESKFKYERKSHKTEDWIRGENPVLYRRKENSTKSMIIPKKCAIIRWNCSEFVCGIQSPTHTIYPKGFYLGLKICHGKKKYLDKKKTKYDLQDNSAATECFKIIA